MIPTNLGISWSQGWCSIISCGRTLRWTEGTLTSIALHDTVHILEMFGANFMISWMTRYFEPKTTWSLGVTWQVLLQTFLSEFYPLSRFSRNSDLEIWREDGHCQRDHKAIQKPRKLAVAVDSLARHSWYMLVWQDYFQNFQSWTFQSHDSHEFQALWILGGIKFHLCFAAVAA